MNGCCGDNPLTRFDGNGTFQESFDGGDTWQDSPQNDPRNVIPVYTPPTGDDGSGKRCSAANSIVAFYQAKVADVQAGKDAAKDEAAMAAIILGFLLVLGVCTGPWMLRALGAAVGAIIAGLSAEAWAAAFTETEYQKLLCAVYCNLLDTGQFDHEGFLAHLGQLEEDLGGTTAGDFFIGVSKGLGQNGMNSLAGLGMDAGLDCGSCCPASCVAGWTFIPTPTGGSMEIDGNALVVTTSDVNTDGKYYLLLERTGGCHEGCGRNNSLQTIVSGGAGQQQQYISKDNCNPDDWTFNINDTCIWRYAMKFNEPTVIRIFFEDCV